MIFVFETLVICFILLCFSLIRKRKQKYPPGPLPLPLIGNLLQLSDEPYCDFISLAKIYGNILSVSLGPQRTIILNDYKDIKHVMAQIEVSGRPEFPHFNDPEIKVPKGVTFTEGREWEEQRRFVVRTLKDFGFGTKSMEVLMHGEIKELLESLRKDVGVPMCTNNRFILSVFNSLWIIVAGEKFSDTNVDCQTLIKHVTDLTKNSESFATIGFFYRYASLFPGYTGLNEFMSHFLPIHDFMKKTVASHKKTFQEGHNRDFLDAYLQQIKNTADTNSSFYKNIGETNLQMVLYDIFFGGTETTSVTLSWTCLLMAHYPDIQEKLFGEIIKTIGSTLLPSLSDKQNTPYIEAVILEVMRFSSIVPLALRRAIMDVSYSGYVIPKGTAVYSNLYAVHQSKDIWGDPENFRPERFLNENGRTIVKKEFMVPFGSGKRMCPGESLARHTLFLFVTSLFQNFKVTLDPSESCPTIEFYKGTLVRIPKPHKIVLVDRNL